MEPNIVLTRIDNRLVHGQVGNSWISSVNANLILVADDEASKSEVLQSVMKMTADMAEVQIRFFSIQKTIDVIHKASPKQKIFLICKTPAVARKLLEGNVPIKKLNVGNMHFSEGKRIFKEAHVYVDDQDVEDLNACKKLGAEVYIEIAPGDKKYII